MKKARQSQDALKKSAHAALVEALEALKMLPVSAAILDRSGTIVTVNAGESLLRLTAYPFQTLEWV